MPTTPCEGYTVLQKANKKIADLKEDIRRLSNELKKKDSLLSSFMEVASEQSKQITSLNTTIQDTVKWDPVANLRLSSCSTPNHQESWAEVVVRGRTSREVRSASPPHLDLSNRYTVLSDDATAHPGDPAVAPAAPTRLVLDPSPSTTSADTVTSPRENSVQAGSHSTVRPDRRPLPKATSSSRCKMLRDAVLRRSGRLPRTEPREDPPSGFKAPGPQSHHTPAQADHLQPVTTGVQAGRALPDHGSPQPSPPRTRPLFTPTTLITGDSIIRNIRFFNVVTRCFPGATVPDILDKLPGLLLSLPSSISRVIVHVGTNDLAQEQSELTKKDFNGLLSFLSTCDGNAVGGGSWGYW
ncbi:uncharacterized protein LOC115592365 [Sparus aurata]|uniref:uncharacterized protein LOC115592365 n=1 Tax=Sparus aurata TaxID=8175 RepID=UPI0011C15BE9|nr:uncharacterized protein LOC115592365 [Sparus aurata]XP_030290873.1 uncharacterized protein LOC115592365 [Sparus aurata]